MKLIEKFSFILGKGKGKNPDLFRHYLGVVKKDPEDAKAHLKLAEIYQKSGDKKRAIQEYLKAADIFAKNNFHAQAMAIYKQVPRQDPSLDHVYLKIADIYRKMGFLGDAFAQYRILVQHYNQQGLKQKALEIMSLMAELDPRNASVEEKIKNLETVMLMEEKAPAIPGLPRLVSEGPVVQEQKEGFFDLGAMLDKGEPAGEMGKRKQVVTLDKLCGFEEIFKELKDTCGPSSVDPHFNFNMGVACREMGFLDDAVEQFQIAFDKNQKPIEAALMLGLSLKEKNLWQEARTAFQKALQVKGISQQKVMEVKYQLDLLNNDQGKTH